MLGVGFVVLLLIGLDLLEIIEKELSFDLRVVFEADRAGDLGAILLIRGWFSFEICLSGPLGWGLVRETDLLGVGCWSLGASKWPILLRGFPSLIYILTNYYILIMVNYSLYVCYYYLYHHYQSPKRQC